MKLPSRFQIGDKVEYGRTVGSVIAIRFTASKVMYDVLNEHSGEVDKNVLSENVAKEVEV